MPSMLYTTNIIWCWFWNCCCSSTVIFHFNGGILKFKSWSVYELYSICIVM